MFGLSRLISNVKNVVVQEIQSSIFHCHLKAKLIRLELFYDFILTFVTCIQIETMKDILHSQYICFIVRLICKNDICMFKHI